MLIRVGLNLFVPLALFGRYLAVADLSSLNEARYHQRR